MYHSNSEQAIILFDGVCNLCNSFVKFVIKHDKPKCFKFAALQSETAKFILLRLEINPDSLPNSVILIDNETIYLKSEAALRIAKKLDGRFKHLYYLKFLPRWFRDPVYDFIARNRYALFGKKNSCMVPTPEMTNRFL